MSFLGREPGKSCCKFVNSHSHYSHNDPVPRTVADAEEHARLILLTIQVGHTLLKAIYHHPRILCTTPPMAGKDGTTQSISLQQLLFALPNITYDAST